jgi:hypothetical protein
MVEGGSSEAEHEIFSSAEFLSGSHSPHRPTTIHIFISSPSDVLPERLRAQEIIRRLDREFSYYFRVQSTMWEREPLVLSHHPQDERNLLPPHKADIVVVIVWSRLGTDLLQERFHGAISGRRPVTGTEWEFEDALAGARERGLPDVLLYRKTTEPDGRGTRDALLERAEQLARLEDFLKRWFIHPDGKSVTAVWHNFESTRNSRKSFTIT